MNFLFVSLIAIIAAFVIHFIVSQIRQNTKVVSEDVRNVINKMIF